MTMLLTGADARQLADRQRACVIETYENALAAGMSSPVIIVNDANSRASRTIIGLLYGADELSRVEMQQACLAGGAAPGPSVHLGAVPMAEALKRLQPPAPYVLRGLRKMLRQVQGDMVPMVVYAQDQPLVRAVSREPQD